MTDNWVEHRRLREANLAKSGEIWQNVVNAVDNCCTSFNKHYNDRGIVENKPQNGHRLLVDIKHKQLPPHISSGYTSTSVQIIYENHSHKISVIVGYDGSPREFQIQSDEARAYLTHGGKEISADEFSRIALEDAFFNARSA